MNLPPPNWYDNPEEPGTYRWWDGAKWSDFVRQSDDADPAASSQERRVTGFESDDYSAPRKQWPAVLGALSLAALALMGLAVAGGGNGDEQDRSVRADNNRSDSDSGVNDSNVDTRAEREDGPPEQQLDEELSSGNPRCWPVWHGQFEPSWECSDVEFLAEFDGDVCAAVQDGNPSVHDYVSSWDQGQSGFMYLSSRRDREELLARIALTHYVGEEQRQTSQSGMSVSEAIAGPGLQSILIAVDAPDRQMQGGMAGEFARASRTWLEEFDRYCRSENDSGEEDLGADSDTDSEELAEESETVSRPDTSLTVHESYNGVFEVECSQESLGSFAEARYDHSEYRNENEEFFDSPDFYAVGVLLAREDWTNDDGLEGTNVEVLVLAGQPGEMNYRSGRGHALPGDVQAYSSYGGDSMVLGDPSPGDLLLWFASGRFAYGWTSWREPTSSDVSIGELEAMTCEVLWED